MYDNDSGIRVPSRGLVYIGTRAAFAFGVAGAGKGSAEWPLPLPIVRTVWLLCPFCAAACFLALVAVVFSIAEAAIPVETVTVKGDDRRATMYVSEVCYKPPKVHSESCQLWSRLSTEQDVCGIVSYYTKITGFSVAAIVVEFVAIGLALLAVRCSPPAWERVICVLWLCVR